MKKYIVPIVLVLALIIIVLSIKLFNVTSEKSEEESQVQEIGGVEKIKEGLVNIITKIGPKLIQPEEDTLKSKKDKCIVEAKKLIPNYLLVSKEATRTRMYQRLDSEWKDGTPISIFNLGMPRGATKEGQNVNYMYPHDKYLIQYPPKQILSPEGVILGTNSFIFRPTVIKDHRNVIFGIDFNQDDLIVTVNWTGFDEEIKELINREELSFEVYFNNDRIHIGAVTKKNYNSEDLICNWTSSDEEGEHTCDVPRLQSINTLTQPDLIDSYLFEILNYTISDCNWVEEK